MCQIEIISRSNLAQICNKLIVHVENELMYLVKLGLNLKKPMTRKLAYMMAMDVESILI
jgi:hypothetical protein